MPDCVECKNYFEHNSVRCRECSESGNLVNFKETPFCSSEERRQNISTLAQLDTAGQPKPQHDIIGMFERQYQADSKFYRDNPEDGKLLKQAKSKWLTGFQRNKYAKKWLDVRDKLLAAIMAGETELVKKAFWASLIASELNPGELPAVVVWGIKRACSIAKNQVIYDMLNVKLNTCDIRGESFYAGFPKPGKNDYALGVLLNQIDIY